MTDQEVRQALLDAIGTQAKASVYAPAIRDLAEAYAWLMRQDQAHGGSVTVGK